MIRRTDTLFATSSYSHSKTTHETTKRDDNRTKRASQPQSFTLSISNPRYVYIYICSNRSGHLDRESIPYIQNPSTNKDTSNMFHKTVNY